MSESKLQVLLPTDKPCVSIFVGECGMGKSYAIKSLVYQLLKAGVCKFGLAISGSKFNGGYDYLPDKYVWGIDDPKEFDTKFGNYIKKLGKYRAKHGSIPPNFIIFDDIVGSINMTSKKLNKFLSTFRHYNTYVFIATQTLAFGTTSTVLRDISEWIFIYVKATATKRLVSKIFEEWGQGCETYEEFKKLLKNCTSAKHAAMLYKPREEVEDPLDRYFEFKADEVPDFKAKFKPN